MAGFTVINPYQQALRAELGCDAICIGTMTSASSALGLFGSPLVGAFSDQMGRKAALIIGALASAAGFSLVAIATSMPLLWLSVIPGSLLAHNFTIAKALVADLAKPEERAGVMGKLGLAAGLGFMTGPLINPFVTTRMQACMFATGVNLLSLLAVFQLPSKPRSEDASEPGSEKKAKTGFGSVVTTVLEAIREVFVLAVAAPGSARVILFLRLGLSLGFHIFYTVQQAILKDKFNFQPNDYSNHFAFIGLTYAFSQLISRGIINRFGKDQTILLIICLLALGVGRFVTALTSSIYVLYAALALVVFALGIVNTSISTTITRIASESNVGGLMGVLDTSEKLAGIGGPAIGGALYAYWTFAPVLIVCAGYAVLAGGVFFAFPRYVLPAIKLKEEQTEDRKSKTE
ncbi:MFS transporter [bacterium]|nr:MFS transporter [bacterium]